jgi:hypothetical protein
MEFTYDKKNSYFNNFYNWWAINSEEKRAFNQKPYGDEEAINRFNDLYGHHNNKKLFNF